MVTYVKMNRAYKIMASHSLQPALFRYRMCRGAGAFLHFINNRIPKQSSQFNMIMVEQKKGKFCNHFTLFDIKSGFCSESIQYK